MNRAPLVSIIVPAFNAARFLGTTLKSICAQTMSDWECIVVDDGSRDDTVASVRGLIAADDRLKLVRQGNCGVSAARNHGYRLANPRSEFVTFMDGDDLWLPDTLAVFLGELRRHPEAAGVHGLAQVVDERGVCFPDQDFTRRGRHRLGLRGGRIVVLPEEASTRFETLLWTNTVYPPGLLLARRGCYEKAGLFDPTLTLIEDWDMVVRLSRHGELRFLNRVVLHYRRHDGNVSAADYHANVRFARLMHHRNFFSRENDPKQKKIVRQSWRAWQRLMFRESWDALKRCWSDGRRRAAVTILARLYAAVHRYIRGYPTLHGL
ncbi:MAG: glycosyltransferase family 2 protein [Gluconacetobacter diazotrophicus]|nr:glycosyltransferase family 2 protein [Gluconacetobacter diazotrophicus]